MAESEPQVKTVQEKVAELYPGLALWKVDINSLREMDKNARVFRKDKFDLLAGNIARDHGLESLPYCTSRDTPGGRREFLIISGHHRTRAARKALVLYILVKEGLTDDQVRSKQLAHNALSGDDDKQVLSEIYQSIADIDERMRSGITEGELKFDPTTMKADDLALSVDFELMQIAFFPHQKQEFEDVVRLLDPRGESLNVAEMSDFKKLKATMRSVSMKENIRNLSTILSKMCAIVKTHYETTESQEPEKPAEVQHAETG